MPTDRTRLKSWVSLHSGVWLLASIVLFTMVQRGFAHSNSVTPIDAKLTTNSLTLTIQLNQPDLLQIATNGPLEKLWFTNATDYATNAPWIRDYVRSRVKVTLDKKLANSTVLDWPVTNTQFSIEIRPDDLQPAPLPIKLRWTIPPGAKELELVFNLYDNPGFSSLFQILFDLGPEAMPVMHVVPTGRKTVIDLAAFAEDTVPPPAPTNQVEKVEMPSVDQEPAAPLKQRHIQVSYSQFVFVGFEHILPLGLDHILFVLGLFLLSTHWKPLLGQVTAFTIAHSITLAIAMFGVFAISPRIVEPLIALSIAAVALENLYRSSVSKWRWVGVFGFGLIHGFGFASVLADKMKIPEEHFAMALLSFNVGVELGQLSVITLAFLAVGWFQRKDWYAARIRNPACWALAAVGIYWTVQRVWTG